MSSIEKKDAGKLETQIGRMLATIIKFPNNHGPILNAAIDEFIKGKDSLRYGK